MGLIADGAILQNEVKAWPPLVGIGAGYDLVTNNQWWDAVGTPTTQASAVPVSGEAGLEAKWREVIKCVTDDANEGFLQRFTYADEPRIKSGAVISALIWVGHASGVASADVTVKLVNSDASETASSVIASTTDWECHLVEGHSCAGTHVDLQITKDTAGTFYAGGPITVMVGASAIGLPPRKGVYRLNPAADTAVENITGSTKAIGDLDLTSASHPLAYQGSFHIEIAESSAGQTAYSARPNGTSWTTGFSTGPGVKVLAEPNDVERMYGDFEMLFDDLQIIETAVTTTSGSPDNARLYLVGWWEWE